MYKLELEIALELDEALPSVMELIQPHLAKIDRFTFRTLACNGNPELKVWVTNNNEQTLHRILEVYLGVEQSGLTAADTAVFIEED
jgi:hypothetical protein